jgi:uncharacterized protein HemY
VDPALLLLEIRTRGIQAAASRCAAMPGCDESAVFADAGQVFIEAEEWDTARKVLEWVIQRHPDSVFAYKNLADALLSLHQDAEALAAYQSALAALKKVKLSPPAMHKVFESRLQKAVQLTSELVTKGR